ncbi:hypothetical protein MHBO_001299 [Bonamia ostreae]|uniref:RBR-type E3 ubiquitin transferase n=1 Tax=Bonamia ostreae TaxID=126728 RepID=A0ABV2AIH0_9EUKA
MESDSFDDDDFEDVTGALRALDVTGNAESPFASMTLAELALFAREKTERFARKQNLSGDCAELVLKQIGFDESKYSPEMAELAAKIDAKLNSIDIDRRGKPRICKICCGDLSEAVSGVPCGHRFCGECWKQYLETAMQTSGINAAKVACPFYGCNSILLSSFLDTVLADETRARYERFCADFFVFHSEDAIDCVNPKCDLFVCRTGGDGRRHGRCKCGALFCFVCEAEDHRPATCAQKYESESSSASYLLVNTKLCPNCGSRIEKNKGCNHMACFNCRHEFCWVCQRDWTEHNAKTGGFYRCNVYRELKLKGELGRDKKRQKSAKYLFYYLRYQNHEQSLKFAQRNLSDLEAKISLLWKTDDESCWSDFDYLRDALLTVTKVFSGVVVSQAAKVHLHRGILHGGVA